jgi:hypothetical protein
MMRIQKGEKSTRSSGNYENIFFLRPKNIGTFNMIKLMVHNEILVRVDFPLWAVLITSDFYCRMYIHEVLTVGSQS